MPVEREADMLPEEASIELPIEEASIELPIDGTLDLHMFHPRETRDLVHDYLAECLKRGILEVRIVHGKGIGVQRRIVQQVLETYPAVSRYWHEGGSGGSWGATIVALRPDSE